MSKLVLITGGTGFIGKYLSKKFSDEEYKIIILSRNKTVSDSSDRYIKDLDEIDSGDKIDIIINLAGESISKRWSPAYKKELINSRVGTTNALIDLIDRLKVKPECLISASAIGYYGNADGEVDKNTKPINGFTHDLCKEWEAAAMRAEEFGVRTCIARFGVVLGKDGGAMAKMLPAFKFYMGGRIGSGDQLFSWVHIEDVIAAIIFLINENKAKGAFNIVAESISNKKFTDSLGNVLNRPTFMHVPSCIIHLIFGEMGWHLLLSGSNIRSNRLKEFGFSFKFTNLDVALQDICH